MTRKLVDALAAPALARQRHEVILAEVRRRGSVRVSDLAALLAVSDMTIRRDLEALDAAGLLRKVHGGATARDEHSSDEPGFDAKSRRNIAEKHAIALAAASMVAAGSAIGITAGTTTWQMAFHLVEIPNLTVVTNSVRVSEVLHRVPRPDRTVLLIGGERTPSDALVGSVALATLRSLHLDTVYLGVHGMSHPEGYTTPNLEEAETNRAFVEATQQPIVLADHTKWSVVGLRTIAPLERASVVVSDTGLSAAARDTLDQHVPRTLLADPQFNVVPAPADSGRMERRRA